MIESRNIAATSAVAHNTAVMLSTAISRAMPRLRRLATSDLNRSKESAI